MLNLAGKDFFTEEEAAHYCCVCLSQFRRKKAEHQIHHFTFMGKKVYRKVDLQEALNRTFDASPFERMK